MKNIVLLLLLLTCTTFAIAQRPNRILGDSVVVEKIGGQTSMLVNGRLFIAVAPATADSSLLAPTTAWVKRIVRLYGGSGGSGGSTGTVTWNDVLDKPTVFPTNYANSGSVRDSIQRRLSIGDSTIYTTRGRTQKGIDSIAAKYRNDSMLTSNYIVELNSFVDNLSFGKKDKNDSTATTGYTTIGRTNNLEQRLRSKFTTDSTNIYANIKLSYNQLRNPTLGVWELENGNGDVGIININPQIQGLKSNADSTATTGYTTIGWTNNLEQRLRSKFTTDSANIYANIKLGYNQLRNPSTGVWELENGNGDVGIININPQLQGLKNNADSTATTGYTTRGTTRRLIDSLRGSLPATFFNGDYNSLTNRPDLSVYAVTGSNANFADLRADRGNGTGVVFFGNANNRYISWDNFNYVVNTASGIQVLYHQGNLDPSIYATTASTNAALNLKANNSNTITINGNTQSLGSNPTFTVSGGGGGGNVASVNGQTGTVVLNANDVGAVALADSALRPNGYASRSALEDSLLALEQRLPSVYALLSSFNTFTFGAMFAGGNPNVYIGSPSGTAPNNPALWLYSTNGTKLWNITAQNNGSLHFSIGGTLRFIIDENGTFRNSTDTLATNAAVRAATPRVLNRTTQTLTYNSTLVLNAANGANATVTLTGNAALSFTNTQDGDEGSITFIQDATGSRIVTIPAGSFQAYGVTGTTLPLSTVAGRLDEVFWKRKGSTFIFSTMQNLVN